MKKYVVLVYVLGLALFPSYSAQAVMRADFPSESLLQPLPEDTAPNISNNVQSTGRITPGTTIEKEVAHPEEKPITVPKKDTPSIWMWVVGALIVGGVLSALYYGTRKRSTTPN